MAANAFARNAGSDASGNNNIDSIVVGKIRVHIPVRRAVAPKTRTETAEREDMVGFERRGWSWRSRRMRDDR